MIERPQAWTSRRRDTAPLAIFGLGGLWPEMARERRETIIAVNFGGCVVPSGLALYELVHLTAAGAPSILVFLVE